MRRGRSLPVLGAGLVVLGLVIGLAGAGRGLPDGTRISDGPLRVPLEHGFLDTADPGSRYVSTGQPLHPGSLPSLDGVTITGIDAPFTDDAIVVHWTGVATARPGGGVTGRLSGWPPPEDERTRFGYGGFHQVDGDASFTIPSGIDRIQPVIVYDLPATPGRYLRRDVTVRYEVHGQAHRLVLPARGLLCVGDVGPCEWTDADQAAVD